MQENATQPDQNTTQQLKRAMCGVMAAAFVYLAWVAVVAQVNPFDSFSLLLNAKKMALIDTGSYFWKRAPTLPLLLTPFQALEGMGIGGDFALIASRLTNVFSFGVLIFLTYRIFRFTFSGLEALAGAFLLSMNALLIHQAPFVKEDIPSTLFTAAAFYFYIRSKKSERLLFYVLSATSIAAAITTRYNLIPLLFAVVFASDVFCSIQKYRSTGFPTSSELKRIAKKLLFFFVVPSVLFFVVHSVVYAFLNITTLLDGPRQIITELFLQLSLNSKFESPAQNYEFLLRALTWPLALLAAFGLFVAWRDRRKLAVFHGLWLLIFFGFQTYIIGHKEARYLFPLFIPVYFFVTCGLAGFVKFLGGVIAKSSIPKTWRQVTLAASVAVLLAWPLKNAAVECFKFQDPIYHDDFEKRVSFEAKNIAGDGDVIWVGKWYPLHPKEYVFHEDDEVTYIYHFYNHVVRYFLGETVYVIGTDKFAAPNRGRFGIFVPGIGTYARSGSVLIINIESRGYDTVDLPEHLSPLFIERVQKVQFFPQNQEGELANVFLAPQIIDASITVERNAEGYEFRGSGLPDTAYELYVVLAEQKMMKSMGLLPVVNGQFTFKNPEQLPGEISAIFLLYFDHVKPIPHPNYD
jgi:hypothetical protein